MEKIFIIVSHAYGEDYNEVKILGAFDNKDKAKENLNQITKVVKEQFYIDNNEEDIESGASETYYHIWENCSYCGHCVEIVETDFNQLSTHKIGNF
jgi:predicted PP-loop superfamily ATPase